jgi:hypothetical protein
MHAVTMKKRDDMRLVISVDPTKVARGHIAFPRAGKHKDKRRSPKVAERAAFRNEIGRG